MNNDIINFGDDVITLKEIAKKIEDINDVYFGNSIIVEHDKNTIFLSSEKYNKQIYCDISLFNSEGDYEEDEAPGKHLMFRYRLNSDFNNWVIGVIRENIAHDYDKTVYCETEEYTRDWREQSIDTVKTLREYSKFFDDGYMSSDKYVRQLMWAKRLNKIKKYFNLY